jgi:hypothetical protein
MRLARPRSHQLEDRAEPARADDQPAAPPTPFGAPDPARSPRKRLTTTRYPMPRVVSALVVDPLLTGADPPTTVPSRRRGHGGTGRSIAQVSASVVDDAGLDDRELRQGRRVRIGGRSA